jgi:hypothetical protein
MQSVGLTLTGLPEEPPRQQAASSLPKVVVFGHSHLGALLAAFDEQARQGQPSVELVFYQFLREDRAHIVNMDGQWRYNPECEAELSHLIARTRPAAIVSML